MAHVIPSADPPSIYGLSDFFPFIAFRVAFRRAGLPLDTPINDVAWALAIEAFDRGNHTSGPTEPEAATLWRRAVEAQKESAHNAH